MSTQCSINLVHARDHMIMHYPCSEAFIVSQLEFRIYATSFAMKTKHRRVQNTNSAILLMDTQDNDDITKVISIILC